MQPFKILSFVSLLCISSAHADIIVSDYDLSETLNKEALHGTYQSPQASIQISKPNKNGAYPFRFQSPNCQISGHAKYGSDAYTAFYISRAPSGINNSIHKRERARFYIVRSISIFNDRR